MDCNRAGTVCLFGYLALFPGIAQICYQELGETIANENSVSMTEDEFSFSSNWKLSSRQSWQYIDTMKHSF